MPKDPVACKVRPLDLVVNVLAEATVAWRREDSGDMLAGRARKKAEAGGVEEVVRPAAVNDLLGPVLRHVRSDQKVLESDGERSRCRIRIDKGICQEENRELPCCMLVLSGSIAGLNMRFKL